MLTDCRYDRKLDCILPTPSRYCSWQNITYICRPCNTCTSPNRLLPHWSSHTSTHRPWVDKAK